MFTGRWAYNWGVGGLLAEDLIFEGSCNWGLIIEAKGGLHPGAYNRIYFLFTGRRPYNWEGGEVP